MKAILMAAGVGSRLAVNPSKPKCLWKIGDIPLIEHTVKLLQQNGVDVAIVLGFKENMIREALCNYNVQYYYNPFFRATNSIASLWFAQEYLTGEEDVILANADVFFEQPLCNLILSDNEYDIILLGDILRVRVGDYFFKTKDKYLVGYGKELALHERTCEYVGIAKLKPSFINQFNESLNQLIKEEKYHLWWENIIYEKCDQFPVYVKDVEGLFWGEIDYIQDYNRIKEYLGEVEK